MMPSIEKWNKSCAKTIGVLLGAAILAGCHSRLPIAVPGSTPPSATSAVVTELKAGDHVRVTMRNGSREAFVMVEAQVDALVAEDGRRFPYADIALLEKTHVSKKKTIALIAAMPFIMVVLVGLTYHGP
jgi:hypothetical protein